LHRFGFRHDEEALESSGEAETVVERDEVDPTGAIAAPDQSGSELEGVGSAQLVDGEEPLGAGAHLLDRLDLEAAQPQIVEDLARLL